MLTIDEMKDAESHQKAVRQGQAEALSFEPTCYVAPVTRAEYEELKDSVNELWDMLRNGIKEEDGKFFLVWTQKQLDSAEAEAEDLAKRINWEG